MKYVTFSHIPRLRIFNEDELYLKNIYDILVREESELFSISNSRTLKVPGSTPGHSLFPSVTAMFMQQVLLRFSGGLLLQSAASASPTRIGLGVPFKRRGRFVLPFEGREGFLNKIPNACCKKAMTFSWSRPRVLRF